MKYWFFADCSGSCGLSDWYYVFLFNFKTIFRSFDIICSLSFNSLFFSLIIKTSLRPFMQLCVSCNFSNGNNVQLIQKKLFDRPSSKLVKKSVRTFIRFFCSSIKQGIPLFFISSRLANTFLWVTNESNPFLSESNLVQGYFSQPEHTSRPFLTTQQVINPHDGCFFLKIQSIAARTYRITLSMESGT